MAPKSSTHSSPERRLGYDWQNEEEEDDPERMMNSFTWDLSSSPSSITSVNASTGVNTPEDHILTEVAQINSAAAGDPSPTCSQSSKVTEWPFAVGSLDFNVFESREGNSSATVQTIIPALVPAAVGLSQDLSLEDLEVALGPVQKLQRKFGIGDRKTRDGQPAKRRGPKPDSKPAVTRRQELNRQAQRTHRERKELYMRELEIAVEHLRRIYHEEVDAVKDENKKLRALLAAHGIQHDLSSASPPTYGTPGSSGFAHSPPSAFDGSHTHSASFTSVSPPTQSIGMQMSLPTRMPTSSMSSGGYSVQQTAAGPVIQPSHAAMVPGMDYSEMGVDFVWKLEESCRGHHVHMVNLSLADETWQSGHSLMLTCPPRQFCADHGAEAVWEPQKEFLTTGELPKPDLVRMLSSVRAFAKDAILEEQVTPVMAWAWLMGHPRSAELGERELRVIRDDLGRRIVCYGFGAVLEDFEVQDAVEKALEAKDREESRGEAADGDEEMEDAEEGYVHVQKS